MTLVRVNEETFNLSHSSNLILAIGLENSSPTSWGRLGLEGAPIVGLLVHCWESKRGSIFEQQESSHFWELGHTFQGRIIAQKSRQRFIIHRRSYSMDFEVHTVTCVHRNRDSRQHLFLSVRYGFYQSVQPYFGTDFEEEQAAILRPYRTDFVQVHTVLSWHRNLGRLLCVFSRKFGMVFKVVIQPLMHPEIYWSSWHIFRGIHTSFWRHRNRGVDL